MRDPSNLYVIPRKRVEAEIGGPTMFDRAERAGIVTPYKTPTGRELVTPQQFAAVIGWADGQRTAKPGA